MILQQWTWSDLDYASNNNNDNGKTKKSYISFEDLNISFRLNTWKETDSSYDSLSVYVSAGLWSAGLK